MKHDLYKLGLTGSIAMGKSTTAGFFKDAAVPVWDADAVVHQLYSGNGPGVRAIATLVPEAIANDAVDRDALKHAIGQDRSLLHRIEAAVHPLVSANRAMFIREQSEARADLAVFDIPLLFETDADSWLDGVLVVTAPARVQRERALTRSDMTQAHLDAILSRQMPDREKRQRANFIIDTSLGLDAARAEVLSLIGQIRAADHA